MVRNAGYVGLGHGKGEKRKSIPYLPASRPEKARRQLDQGLLALDRGHRHFRRECRAVVPARSSCHGLLLARSIMPPLRGKSTYPGCSDFLSHLCFYVPAALESVLAVGAMDAQGNPIGSSTWGEAYQTQGILAPGVNIWGAIPGGGTAAKSGTKAC